MACVFDLEPIEDAPSGQTQAAPFWRANHFNRVRHELSGRAGPPCLLRALALLAQFFGSAASARRSSATPSKLALPRASRNSAFLVTSTDTPCFSASEHATALSFAVSGSDPELPSSRDISASSPALKQLMVAADSRRLISRKISARQRLGSRS